MKGAFYFIFFVCYFLFASCSHVSQSNFTIIDLINHIQLPKEEILLSDISESIEMIYLETNDSVLVSRISNINVEVNKLYVQASNGVFVFDSDGKFLNSISARGRGPREYVSLSCIFPEEDVIWLLDNSGKKALKFTVSGKFLEDFEFEKQMFTDFYYSGGDSFIGFIPDNGQPNTDIMLAFFTATGIVDSILYRNPISVGNIYWSVGGEASFINHRAQIKFKHLFNDTIYVIQDNMLIPDMVLDLGARKANENARAIAVNKDSRTHDICEGMDKAILKGESDRYVCLRIANDYPPLYYDVLFYDKKEQKVHKWEFILPEDERLDHEQAKKFVPMYIDKNGNLIGQTAPANEEDNPVIVIAKLKH